MKVHIWKDERYPDYGISLDDSPNAEIDVETYAWYKAVNSEYGEMQQALEAALKEGVKS